MLILLLHILYCLMFFSLLHLLEPLLPCHTALSKSYLTPSDFPPYKLAPIASAIL